MKRSRPISRYDTTTEVSKGSSSSNNNSRGGPGNKGKGKSGGGSGDAKEGAAKSNKSLKNQVRSLERFIKRDGLSPIIIREKQKEIEKLKGLMESKTAQENERNMATKYHKVKFFERVKVDRKVKQLRKNIAIVSKDEDTMSGPGAKKMKKLKNELNEFRNKAKYIKYFPKGEKYISLYVADEKDEKLMSARKAFMKAAIAEAKEAEANGEKEAADVFAEAVGRDKREKKLGLTKGGKAAQEDDEDSAAEVEEQDDFFKTDNDASMQDESNTEVDASKQDVASDDVDEAVQASGKKRKLETKEKKNNKNNKVEEKKKKKKEEESDSDSSDSSDSSSDSDSDSSSSDSSSSEA